MDRSTSSLGPRRTSTAPRSRSPTGRSRARAQGHVNLPFENAAARLAFIASESDGFIRNSVDERRFGENDFWGLRGSLAIEPSELLRLELMVQRLRDDGASAELWTPGLGFFPDPDDIRLTTVTLKNPFLVSENDNVSLDLEYELGSATIRSISGYARSEVRNLDDCAGQPMLLGCVRGVRPSSYRQRSQEVHLALRQPGPLTALVGVYYFEADATQNFHLLVPLLDPPLRNDSHTTSTEAAGAIFGQGTLDLGEAWSFTGGLRLSREIQRRTTVGSGVQDRPVPVSGEIDSSNTSWRLDLSYAATEEAHLYAGVSTGFKSGGLLSTLVEGELDSFGPETLVAYEAGGKSRWFGGRLTLNAAVFHYDFEDLQVSTITAERPVLEVANAAKAALSGLDVEAVLHLSERLTLAGGTVWLPKREFVRFDDRVSGETLSGNRLALAPEWTTTASIHYRHPLAGLGRLSGRLEHNYRSGYFFTKENVPSFAQEPFGLLNAYLELEAASGRWYVFASGRNLTDENYFLQVFLQSVPGYPDTFELGVGYRFYRRAQKRP